MYLMALYEFMCHSLLSYWQCVFKVWIEVGLGFVKYGMA